MAAGVLHELAGRSLEFTDTDWPILAGLAAEGRVGAGVLQALGGDERWLSRMLAQGTLVAAGKVRSLALRTSGLEETGFEFVPGLRQLVLRGAQARGILAEAVSQTSRLLGVRATGALSLKLQMGALPRRTEGQRSGTAETERRLREALLEPFDAVWLEQTWGAQAPEVAARVLSAAQLELDECTELYEWASRASALREDWPATLRLALAEQALLRGHAETALQVAVGLEARERFVLLAAASLVRGETSEARELLSLGLAFSDGKLGGASDFEPWLVALLLSSRAPSDEMAARSWLKNRGHSPSNKGAARALRLWLRLREEPAVRLERIDPHQLPPQTGPWEILILASAVCAFQAQPLARAAWSRWLVERSLPWGERGYSWLRRQAWALSAELDPAQLHGGREPGPVGPTALHRLLAGEAPWERSLSLLESLAVEVAQPERKHRLEWFVNMTDGSLNKPGLQDFQSGRGWSTAQRLSLDEAREKYADLPDEDRAVLDASHPVVALIGHPRVVDGARGSSAVEVLRGSCQLETFDEAGFLRVSVTPPGLQPGVNVLVEGERRLLVVEVSAAMQRVLEALPGEVLVPRERQGRALELLGRLSESVQVKSTHLGGQASTVANATPCLRLRPLAGAWLVEGGVRPFGAHGRFFVVGTGPSFVTRWSEGTKLTCERDFDMEQRRLTQLIAACPSLSAGFSDEESVRAPGESRSTWTYGGDAIAGLLAEVRDSTLACEFEWINSPAIRLRGQVTHASVQGSLRARKGWYLVKGSVALEQVTPLTLAELVRLPSLAGGRFRRLPSGDLVEIEARIRRVLAALAVTASSGESGRLHASHRSLLGMLAELPGVGVDDETRADLARAALAQRRQVDAPQSLTAELRPYQLAGFRWLRALVELGHGACLADDMGLGKTVQILALLASLPEGARCLVVAPTSVCSNWLREAERFTPTLSAREYLGPAREELVRGARPRLLICSYALLHEDSELLQSVDFDAVVLDEAQFIKNPLSQRARAAFGLRAPVRIAASGTPIENHLGDLWSVFHFINPELLGSWQDFKTFFSKPIEREGDPNVAATLREMVQPYLLRRLKSQVLSELPVLTTVRHELELSADESLRYAQLRREIHIKLRTAAGKQQNKLEILAEISRLRRFCCHPRLVFPDATHESRKLDALVEIATELRENGHHALVFSQYVDFLSLARERLDEVGMAYEYLDGSTPKAQRQASIDAFQTGKKPLFLISLKAGGLGLNLTTADYVIHLDPWWNPAVSAQATDRAHRIGQTRPVTVYQFVTKSTIEEDILELHEHKQRLADDLLHGGERAAGLSVEELVSWLEKSYR